MLCDPGTERLKPSFFILGISERTKEQEKRRKEREKEKEEEEEKEEKEGIL